MKNKIVAVGTLSLLTLLSFGKNITNANAADIADPTGWDWKYDYDSTSANMELTTSSAGTAGIRIPYTSPSATNYEMDSRDQALTVGDVDFPLVLKMYFGISTTSWSFDSGYYYPATTVQTLGSVSATSSSLKFQALVINPTDHTWDVAINLSDSSATPSFFLSYSDSSNVGPGQNFAGSITQILPTFTRSSTLIQYFRVPPFTTVDFGLATATTSTVLVRGLWFKEQGQLLINNFDDVYQQGFDAGFQDGFLDGQDSAESNVTFRISDLLNRVFSGVGTIFNIKVFDQLTMGTVLAFPIAFTIFTFVFRLIRGGKA
jgi:hypothetical protein